MTKPIKGNDPRHNLIQEILEGDARMQDVAAARLRGIDELVRNAEAVAADLTQTLIPEDLRAAGYRFAFETTPIPITKEDHG